MTSDTLISTFNQRSQTFWDWLRGIPVSVWRRLVIAVLSLWLCYTLAQLVWVLMPEPALPEPPLTLPNNAVFTDTASTGSAGVDINALKSLELFGKPGEVVEEVAVEIPTEIDAPDTSLRLELKGVAPSNRDESSSAIIADGGRQGLFFPKDELTIGPRGVKLVQVKNDRIILDNNGKLETLWLYRGKDDFKSSGRPQLAQTVRRAPIPVNRPDVSQNVEPSQETSEFVNGLRPEDNQLVPTAEQIKSIDDVMGISMYREGGQLVGFRIRPKRNRQIFDELGLQPNDVVTAVNNIGLTDTSQAMELYRSLSQTTQVSLEILREGATINVDINLDNFSN